MTNKLLVNNYTTYKIYKHTCMYVSYNILKDSESESLYFARKHCLLKANLNNSFLSNILPRINIIDTKFDIGLFICA